MWNDVQIGVSEWPGNLGGQFFRDMFTIDVQSSYIGEADQTNNEDSVSITPAPYDLSVNKEIIYDGDTDLSY